MYLDTWEVDEDTVMDERPPAAGRSRITPHSGECAVILEQSTALAAGVLAELDRICAAEGAYGARVSRRPDLPRARVPNAAASIVESADILGELDRICAADTGSGGGRGGDGSGGGGSGGGGGGGGGSTGVPVGLDGSDDADVSSASSVERVSPVPLYDSTERGSFYLPGLKILSITRADSSGNGDVRGGMSAGSGGGRVNVGFRAHSPCHARAVRSEATGDSRSGAATGMPLMDAAGVRAVSGQDVPATRANASEDPASGDDGIVRVTSVRAFGGGGLHPRVKAGGFEKSVPQSVGTTTLREEAPEFLASSALALAIMAELDRALRARGWQPPRAGPDDRSGRRK